MNGNNQPVDWWAAIKYPNVADNENYQYVDADSTEGAFVYFNASTDGEGQALANTIAQINLQDPVNLLVFNDEFPNRTTIFTGAHAKGIMSWDQNEKVLLYIMHSVPIYPNVSETGEINYTFNSNAYYYGQNFFCVTIKADSLAAIKQNLATSQVNVYASFGAFNEEEEGFLEKVVGSDSTINQFEMTNGDTITMLSKSPDYAGFLYEGIIQPFFQTDLMVQSWGRPWQDPMCEPAYTWDSTNINKITFSNGNWWTSYYDHSKWAISYDSSLKIACPADMNRMDSQSKRGGSALCYENPILYSAYNAIVNNYTKCSDNDNTFTA
jgi:deoxyribonuclease-2